MITLFGTLLGFLGSMVPDLLKMFQDSKDKRHEKELMALQMQMAQAGHNAKLQEIELKADIADYKAVGMRVQESLVGIKWVDALNGTVRPVLAYSFFFLYAALKMMQFAALDWSNPLPWQVTSLWGEEDQAIFAGIMAFYFGGRAMQKVREGK